jgi:hypothetical protein
MLGVLFPCYVASLLFAVFPTPSFLAGLQLRAQRHTPLATAFCIQLYKLNCSAWERAPDTGL